MASFETIWHLRSVHYLPRHELNGGKPTLDRGSIIEIDDSGDAVDAQLIVC
jgi:hypothetical protein